ncbi:CRP/FNR family transcriptional regulator [Pedobacter sp. UYEF25]
MENSLLAAYMRSKFQLSPDNEALLFSRLYPVTFIKGTDVLQPNEICKYVYFLESGFFRHYDLIEGEEHTLDFAVENEFSTVLQSFLHQHKNKVGIIAEADTMTYRLSYYDWMALEDHSTEFLLLSKRLLCSQLLKADYERTLYRTASTAEKYTHFCQYYRTASQMARHKDIASYLGITSPSFSRFLKGHLTKR